MSDPRNLPPPRMDVPRNGTVSNGTPVKATSPSGIPSFLAPFLGAFAAVFILVFVVGGGYLGYSYFHSTGKKTPLQEVTTWQEGSVAAQTPAEAQKADIGFWVRHYDLPDRSAVANYLKQQGLTVNNLEAVHYVDSPDAATLTYALNYSVPGELLRVPQAAWTPNNPDQARFARILVLNKGLPPGIYWDIANAKVAASANLAKDTLFTVHWNKVSNTVQADRILPHDLVNQQQIGEYQGETEAAIGSLVQHIQQIDSQVQNDIHNKLAQVPADPPKPQPQTAHFGGDGSGEPTKSAARIGGGAAAGAAGGALFGAAAGNAGMGAGVGAGVGLLGGIIYNAVSKSNDKEKLEREVADENQERLDNWRSEIKSLKQQRASIEKSAGPEREAAMENLAAQIASNQGYLEPANTQEQSGPNSNQPTGPVHPQ